MTKQEKVIAFVVLALLGIGAVLGSLVTRLHINRQLEKVIARADQPRVTKVAPETIAPFASLHRGDRLWTHQVRAGGEPLAGIIDSHLERIGLSPEKFDQVYRCALELNQNKLNSNGRLAEGTIVLVPFKTGLSEAELKAKACPRDSLRIVESSVDIELVPNSVKSAPADETEEGPTLIRTDVFRAYHKVQAGDTPWDLTKAHCADVSRNQLLWATDQVQVAGGIVNAKRMPIGTELPYYEVPWSQKPKASPKHCEYDSFWRVHVVNGKELWRERLE